MSRLQFHFPIGSILTLSGGRPGVQNFPSPFIYSNPIICIIIIIHPSHSSLLLHAPFDQWFQTRFNGFFSL